MKKFLFVFGLLSLLLFNPKKVNAESLFGQWKTQVQERRQERQEVRLENKERWKGEVLNKHAARLENRFNFYYQKFSTIITRLEAKTLSAEAKAKLNEAKTKLESVKLIADEAVALFKSATNQDEARLAKDKATSARQGYVEVMKLLVETVKLLKTNK